MVFESVLVQVLNSILGDYIENLDKNQLNVGIWGGDVLLKNLLLKQSALKNLDLPIQTIYGKIGTLVLKIPWKNLYGAAFVIDVEDIFLLAAPNTQTIYDEEKEKVKAKEAKQVLIKNVELAKKVEQEKEKVQKADYTFVEKLVTQIIKNLQLNIKRIHIRYEDKVTDPKNPFAVGVTLGKLNVVSTDETWEPKITQENITKIFKIVSLDSLAVYWNCEADSYSDITDNIEENLLKDIATSNELPENFSYILGPINASARLKINQKPEQDEPAYSIPKIHLNLDLQKLYIGLSKAQYKNIITLVNAMDRMIKADPFRKYRPRVPQYHGHAKEWWQFAYKCVLVSEVRRRRNNWDWNHISAHRNMCKNYQRTYQNKLMGAIQPAEQCELEDMEEKLDIFNIVVIRQRVEFETERLKQLEANKPKKGWFGWMWGGAPAETDIQSNDESNGDENLSAQEKAKLYKAIGYQEGAPAPIYPETYVDVTATFLLRTLELEIIDKNTIMFNKLNGVKCRYDSRASAQAMKVHVKIDELSSVGFEQDDFIPSLITSETNNAEKALLEVTFEKNPIDKKCDQRLNVSAQPIKIIYDAITINNIIKIFSPDSSSDLEQIQAAAAVQVHSLKEKSTAGFQYAIEKHTSLDVNIDLHAPIILVPYGGKYNSVVNVIVVNLGKLVIRSVDRPHSDVNVRKMYSEGIDKEEILNRMIDQSYDRFQMEFTELQLLLCQGDEDWSSCLKQSVKTDLHIVVPVSLNLTLYKCLFDNDARLPLIKIRAELPSVDVTISDAKILLLYTLIMSIPLPQSELQEVVEPPMVISRSSSRASHSRRRSIDPASAPKKKSADSGISVDGTAHQLVKLDAHFVMKELKITVGHQEDSGSPIEKVATLLVENLQGGLSMTKYTISSNVRLTSIQLKQYRPNDVIDIISIPTGETEDLVDVAYLQVNEKSPEFRSKFDSCKMRLSAKVSVVNVNLHQEGLLSLIQFQTQLQNDMEELGDVQLAPSSLTRIKRSVSIISGISYLSQNIIDLGENLVPSELDSRVSSIDSIINLKVKGKFKELRVMFSTEKSQLSEVSIKGIAARVLIRSSDTVVHCQLKDLTVVDLNPQSIHKQILTVDGEETLNAKITLNNVDQAMSVADIMAPDIEVEANMSGLKIIFLNWFVTNMLNFINNFQAAKDAIIQASANAAEVAKQSAHDAYEKATKISLNIILKAPDIIIPTNSKSLNCLGLDLGHITITNRFNSLELNGKDYQQDLAVIDRLRIALTNFKLSKIKLNEKNEIINEDVILQPLSLKLVIKRNLSASWYRKIPNIDMSGNIDEIKINFSNLDMATVTSTVNGNLAEGNEPQVNAPKGPQVNITPIPDAPKLSAITVASHAADVDTPVYTTLRFTITMAKLELNLFTASSMNSAIEVKNLPQYHLSRFSLEGLSCKGSSLSDSTFSTSVLLIDCVMDDMRPNRDDLMRRMIERSTNTTAPPGSPQMDRVKSMLDITFKQKQNDMFADVRVSSFTFILSIEYVMKLVNFFTSTLEADKMTPAPQTSKAIAQTKATQQNVAATAPKNVQKMTINLKIEKPDIILVEDMGNVDTSAIILHSEIQLKYRVQGAHQVVSGTVTDLEIVTCNYNPLKRKETSSYMLFPVTVSIAGSTPVDKGLHVELLLTDIRFCLSPSTIGLLSNIFSKINATDSTTDVKMLEQFQHEDLWHPKAFSDDNYWYLRTDTAVDAVDLINSRHTDNSIELKKALDELCIINVPCIILALEAGEGQKTRPMLLMESKFHGSVKNWSSQLNVEASLWLMMGYYNSFLALWEPLIEPVQSRKHGMLNLAPWELTLEMAINNPEDQSVVTPTELDITPISAQPVTSIDITSKSTLELTMTKTCLYVLTGLSGSFSTAMQTRSFVPVKRVSSHKFVNDIGSPVTLLLSDGPFKITGNEFGVEPNEVILENGAEVNLEFRHAQRETVKLSDALILQSYEIKAKFLTVKVNEMNTTLELPVMRADKRYFTLKYRVATQCYGVISDLQMVDGIMTITLRSILQVHNHFSIPIEVYILTTKGNEIKRIAIVEPKKFLNVPLSAVYTPTEELFFGVEGYAVTSVPFVWKELQANFNSSKLLHCRPKDVSQGTEPFTIRAVGKMHQVFYESSLRHTMASTCYNVHLRPSLSYVNYLPIPIICCLENVVNERTVEPGSTLHLPNCCPGQSVMVIRLENYLDKVWSCRKEIPDEIEEFSVWTFNSYDSSVKVSLNLGVHRKIKQSTIILELYSPFWMLNKTGLHLSFKSSDDVTTIIHHPPDYNEPILFSFSAKSFFSKKKASVRVRGGTWSDKFSLDVAGSSGVVMCKTDDQLFQVGVLNHLSSNGLTKQVTFSPYYVIINNTSFAIEFQESIRPADHWLKVEPESCASLWPISEYDDKLLRLRIFGTTEISQPFLYTESHTTLLKLGNKYGGINVDIQITEGGIYINLASYGDGMAPALIVNYTRDDMNFWEKESAKISKLKKKHSMLYTWENPSGPRILVWEGGNKCELENDLRKDAIGDYIVGVKANSYKIYWVSFLDGMQRVLLFTEDSYIAENVQSAKNFETVDQELTVSLYGVGLSLLDNTLKKDIMYLGITSSGIIWETSKLTSHRYKHMNQKESAALEAAYQDYLATPDSKRGTVHVGGKTEVDFALGEILKPNKRRIKRSFQTGVWLQQKSSSSQLQLHAKLNRLQIDNQLTNCMFPVVLASVNPPKSVALNSGIKPFAEMSVVQLFIKNSQIKQFKYFKVLIQEFHVKVEMGFVNALLGVVAQQEYTEEEEKAYFEKDMNLAREKLYTYVSTQSLQEQKSFYDVLHFSPLKIHVSFSIGASSGESADTSNFLNVILSGIGVTVTDMQDVIFKLAFFEREYTFLTQKQLLNEASKHYVGQLLKQVYVLVLGLDVLGNPYGLVLGITKGVEDLFYEPFQGAIQGPGEFAEGLALGVRSLFGHTVGGAAGAVSRITGAMGKGVAALTFDDDYQRKRRDQISKKPTSIQEGFARGGKGLVMGVFDGVTGVVTKPISGAKEEGVGGFFKGLGKGAVGLIARPTSGVIDFASGSLDAVKRATDLGEEATRLRPARFIQADGLIKPYNKLEAEGNKLLVEVDKGKYSKTDVYVFHYQVEKKEILLLTDQRMAYIVHNEIFGGWQVDWYFTWPDLTHPAKVVPKGILIPITEKKKKLGMFGSNDSGKLILITNPHDREVICHKIEALRGNV